MIPANTTPEEYFKYHCKDEVAVQMFERSQYGEQGENLAKQLEEQERRNELLSEQNWMAQNLIEELETVAKTQTRMRDFKKTLEALLQETQFER